MDLILGERYQYLIFTGLSLLVFLFVTLLYFSNNQIFQRFLGSINPLLAFLIIIILGFFLLSFLLHQKGFMIYEKENLKGTIAFSGLAALLGIIMILADTKIVFPADTNILYPDSLLFYPAIGFFVEILFHVLPLAVLLFILNSIIEDKNFGIVIWFCIIVIALIEAIYQMANMVSAKQHPVWAILFVGFHVFLIGFFQLVIFRKYDFVAMYSFRLVYYLFWHVGWGYWRLSLLF